MASFHESSLNESNLSVFSFTYFLPYQTILHRAEVVVKWSACSPSSPTIQDWIPLTPTVFSVNFVFEKNENKQKEAGVGHLKNEKKHFKSSSKESFTEKNWKALDTEQNCYHPLGTFSCLFILPIRPYPSTAAWMYLIFLPPQLIQWWLTLVSH